MGCFNRGTKHVRTVDEALPRIHVLSFGSCIALRHRVGPQVFELLVQLVLRHLCRTSPPGPRAVVRPRAPPAPIAESWKFDQKCPRKSKLGKGAAVGGGWREEGQSDAGRDPCDQSGAMSRSGFIHALQVTAGADGSLQRGMWYRYR